MSEFKYGFIGAGQMASAMAGGLVAAELAQGDEIFASDPSEPTRQRFAELVPGAKLTADNAEVAASVPVVVLAVKPQIVANVLPDLAASVGDSLVVSIVTGVSTKALEHGLGSQTRVVRVMPNTPMLIGRGASGYAAGTHATGDDLDQVARMLNAVGLAFEVTESQLDAVTGVSGSGPAYVYTMIEALSDGGVLAGLPRQVALQLAAQTVAGAAEMVLNSPQHPAQLREAVTSPGGTTIAAVEALEQGGLRAALIAAVKASCTRSQELGNA